MPIETITPKQLVETPERYRSVALAGQVQLEATDRNGRPEYAARYVSAGRIRAGGDRPGHLEITEEALFAAANNGLFDTLSCFIDHPGWFENPSLSRLAGVTKPGAYFDSASQAVEGVIRLYDNEAGRAIRELLDQMLDDGPPYPDIGLSIVFWPERWEVSDDIDDPVKILEIRAVDSVDFVFKPAADGRIVQALSTLFQGASTMPTDETHPTDAPEQPLEQASPAPPPAEAPVPADGWETALQRAAVPAILAASGLPAASRERLARASYRTPQELEQAIQDEREFLAALTEDDTIQIGGTPPRDAQITVGLGSLERVQLALDALLGGTSPEQGVRPLSGIREAYVLLSGDYEMTGMFRPERIALANVNSSTMAAMVANAMNKRVVTMFNAFPRWWEPICINEDFSNLQDVRWTSLGGVGELPTVAEGATYSELTWDDQVETDSFVKKGGYLGLTLESMDKDDTGRLRAAPRALAQAAWLTLGKLVSAVFTDASGTGPTMSDGNVLFDSGNHGNLLTTALSHAAYVAVRTAMRKQTEIHSAERLGALTAPKYLLVPPDLEITALQVLATEQTPGSANWNANPLAQGNSWQARMDNARDRVIVVDLWTDTNNWAAVCDPNLYPTIGIGYRYGRTPEIFSVASPTAGLMFTNDTMPVKVRFFVAVGPMDWRGLHKNNVS